MIWHMQFSWSVRTAFLAGGGALGPLGSQKIIFVSLVRGGLFSSMLPVCSVPRHSHKLRHFSVRAKAFQVAFAKSIALCARKEPKVSWSYVSQHQTTPHGLSFTSNGQTAILPGEIANLFDNQFASVFSCASARFTLWPWCRG